jgi:hypothetical protein
MDQQNELAAIEVIDRSSQPVLWIFIGLARQRIVNAVRPILLLECRQDGLLRKRFLLEALNDPAANAQLAAFRIVRRRPPVVPRWMLPCRFLSFVCFFSLRGTDTVRGGHSASSGLLAHG